MVPWVGLQCVIVGILALINMIYKTHESSEVRNLFNFQHFKIYEEFKFKHLWAW